MYIVVRSQARFRFHSGPLWQHADGRRLSMVSGVAQVQVYASEICRAGEPVPKALAIRRIGIDEVTLPFSRPTSICRWAC